MAFPPARILLSPDEGIGPERRHCVPGHAMLTIPLSGPENQVTVRLLLAFSPHRCHYDTRRFDLNGRFLTMRRRGLWGATTRLSTRMGTFLSQSICGTITWIPSTTSGRRACLRIRTAKIA